MSEGTHETTPGDGCGEPTRPAAGASSARNDNVTITPYPDGPLLVRGAFEITTADGFPVPTARATVALCRCGASAIKPFCDGTHKLVNFRTEE